jgi:hypothetical protein
VPFQFLAVYAQAARLPAFASEHEPTGQVPASAAGREGFGVEGEFHGSVSELQMPYPITESAIA